MDKIIQGNCLDKLKELEDNSIDSIVTDPPYELGFMGKSWDNTGIANNKEMWAECLRVLKPGGYLLAFSGTRTYHRMAVAIEDAGFEVRDMIEWVYGSGFPKSLNIGKQIDKLRGNEREVVSQTKIGKTSLGDNSGWDTSKNMKAIKESGRVNITKGTSEWEGWGTALKPAHEPICMARKPLAEKTVAENCLKYGTGGINIDESRVEAQGEIMSRPFNDINEENVWNAYNSGYKKRGNPNCVSDQLGRFPANLIQDNSEEVKECFPETKQPSFRNGDRVSNNNGLVPWNKGRETGREVKGAGFTDTGNASRFFKGIPQVVDLHDFSIYNRSILTKIKQLCGQHLTKKKTDITLDGVIQEVEKFIQDAELLMSGNSTTIEKFLTDIVSITKTLIAQMIELKTLNVLPNWLITKFTEENEQTIKLLKELNTEDVKSAKSIFLLQTFISEVLESIRAIAEIVAEQDSNNGDYKSLLYQAKASRGERNAGCDNLEDKPAGMTMRDDKFTREHMGNTPASEREPVKNNHPTVKPIALMEYLIKMITPKGGIVLDPFAGSGSTLVAAKQNGFQYIGIEMTAEYIPIIEARLSAVNNKLI